MRPELPVTQKDSMLRNGNAMSRAPSTPRAKTTPRRSADTRKSRGNETAWPPNGQVPFDTWIGFKFVIYNGTEAGTVKLEAYRDLTNGENGGDWQLVNETVDEGGWFVESACPEHAPNGDGESDLVVVGGGTTFIRNTEVTEARYRWVSVREIAPF